MENTKAVKAKAKTKKQYCVVRTESAGVFAGNVLSTKYTPAGCVVAMENARRIWYWEGAATLSQLALEGTKKPERCKFPAPVSVTLIGVIEIIPATEISEKSITSVPVWREE